MIGAVNAILNVKAKSARADGAEGDERNRTEPEL